MGDFFKSATVGYRGSWREGSFPRATAGDLVVSYDQKHHAYRIEAEPNLDPFNPFNPFDPLTIS